MASEISIGISVIALCVSAITFWLTLLRKGTIEMTRPTVIFFGPDINDFADTDVSPKVFLRTLLFSTSKRGRIIENMYVTLSRNEMHQNFNVWVYGETQKLTRGSGLFVGETGVSANHHFLTPKDGSSFHFIEGKYQVEVFAHLLGDRKRKLLYSQELEITKDIAEKLNDENAGVYYDWGPDAKRYIPYVESSLRRSVGTSN